MTTFDSFRELALSFPNTTEAIHFDRIAFRTPKRIFATMIPENTTANIRLSPDQQSELISLDSVSIYPVPNKWGAQGWTTVDLVHIRREILLEILTVAYSGAIR